MTLSEMRRQNEFPFYTVSQAAKAHNVTRQAIYVAISKGNLKSLIIGRHHYVDEQSLDEYKRKKYSRRKSIYNGSLLFGEDEISVREAAKQTGIPIQRIYYVIRCKKIPFIRKRMSYILKKSDLVEYKKVLIGKKKRKRKQISKKRRYHE